MRLMCNSLTLTPFYWVPTAPLPCCLSMRCEQPDLGSPCTLAGLDDWRWLTNDFSLTAAIHKMLSGTGDRWRSWFGDVDNKATLLNQLFTYSILRLFVARNALVPSESVRWQDLENEGMAIIGTPGKYKWGPKLSAG